LQSKSLRRRRHDAGIVVYHRRAGFYMWARRRYKAEFHKTTVTTKQHIIEEIRRLALERGGRIGFRAFCNATGIPEHQILGMHWSTWNEALTEAGVLTSTFFQPRTQDAAVIEAFVQLIHRLKKWPTQTDLLLERRGNSSFPSVPVIRRVKRESPFASRIVSYCSLHKDLADVSRIAGEVAKNEKAEPPDRGRAPIHGYVYMMRSGRRYKIGFTSAPSRRHREVRLDLPDPTILVHSIATDDPAGIEAYWHGRFQSKRVRDTEFFDLDAGDVAAFKRRKYQ